MKNTDFKPIRITGITNTERFVFNQIRKDYTDMCQLLDGMKIGLDDMLYGEADAQTQSSFDFFSKFIDAKDPGLYIRENYIKIKKISIPGIKTESLTKSDLLDISSECMTDTLDMLKKFKKIHSKQDYQVNIKELYIPANKYQYEFNGQLHNVPEGFDIPEDFEQKWEEWKSVYSENEEQNAICFLWQKAIDAANDMIEKGLIPNDVRWGSELANRKIVSIDRTNPRPLSISRNIFRKYLIRSGPSV